MGRFRYLWTSVLLMLPCLICWELAICAAVKDEGWAMLRFRERVELDPFGALAGWNGDGAVELCSWFGVKCVDGRVVALELENLGLQGTLAPELGRLTYMKFPKRVRRRLLQVESTRKRGLHKNDKNQERTHTSTITAPVPSPSSLPIFFPSHPPGAAPSRSAIPPSIFLPPSFSNEVPTAQPSPTLSNFLIPAPSTSPTSSYSVSVPFPSPSPIILPPLTTSSGESIKRNHTSFWTIFLSIIGGISFVVCLAIVFICCCRATKVVTVRPWSTGLSGQLQKAFVSGVPSLKRSEIETACEGFSNVIGSLPSCKLYKGTLSSGVEIAVVSTLNSSSKDWSKQCESQFEKKISTLSKVNHKNFVNLLGYCAEEEPFTRMMVFEYAPNGTLFEHLHEKEAEHLDWAARLRIAMGVAYCLDHMLRLNPPVTIKNLKSSSIYLTDDYAAKVSDLTFWSEPEEINSPNHNSEQNNTVYRFGLLLIELISGRISSSGNDAQLEIWASRYLNGERPLKEMVDPLLAKFREEDVNLLRDVILSCINPDTQKRSTMAEVAGRLKEITAMTPERVSPALSPLWWAELEILSSESN
ncbi:putative LRR receptor-like serine/threonine-protein kinase MRH1 [Apostasia shenzhenica]|uniref:Putative LRR receptor-like serine/threonine-protein kinase MRH1 n=1 Tax=Apostasia shenzhenica TaxID=1088818 RepID=A0A2I0BGJ4_9ASPA|nr:putative LRR receptor-like serine/threonine-protein kinase MRH1 [Apostasia shenzhenica]